MESNYLETVLKLMAEKIDRLNEELLLCKMENEVLKQNNEALQRGINRCGDIKSEQTFVFGGEK
jgi:hypothetical protein